MIERPDLSDEAIRTALREHWGISTSELAFLPIGNDSGAWVFRAGDHFLKVRKGTPVLATLLVPAALYNSGIRQVVAPVPTRTGELFAQGGDFSLILYPFIEGRSGMEGGLTDSQFLELGVVLRQIHEARLPEMVQKLVPKETFLPRWAPVVKELDELIGLTAFMDPSQQALAAFWKARRSEILSITERCEELGSMAVARNARTVLCHADIHTANILVDPAGGLHVVDWDQPIYAPAERDLMFQVGEMGSGLGESLTPEKLFLQGYGPVEIDRVTMAYYGYEWVVQEFGDYGERVFLMPGVGEITRAASVKGFIELFNPGDVVESAYRWEKVL